MTLKKILCLCLCVCVLLPVLCSCTNAPASNETTASPTQPKPTESAEEANALRIMILGSSRSVNTFHLLYEVFKDQMPDREITLGIMYYSGCSMSMHTNFIKKNQPVYAYYRNNKGYWEITRNTNMEYGLRDQAWDVILLQAGTGDLSDNMNEPCRKFLTEYVDSVVTHPHTFWWHTTWFNSTDPALYQNANTTLKPESIDQVKQLTDQIDAAKKYVLEDPMFEGRICSGTPMMYALKELKIPETALYRDHTHLCDYGSLLVGYSWYVQFTGKPVTQINLDVIPQNLRIEQHQYLGDLQITDQMKQEMIQTAQYTLENPWTIPGQ
ncbi:MAG: DUF4886 domain-containing protein [Oscillospiraceae bacterium]|nr:DUF4886 domain-containing protein [Oscillospiraceae bacterium]